MIIKKVALGNAVEAFIEDSFTEGVNIVFSDDNNKGKTIVIQSMLYALGNKPIFPSSFDYKNYYYYLEFEEAGENYSLVRTADSYIVATPTGIRIFEEYPEFKRFWNSEIFALPQIIFQSHKRIVDMELFSQLFFVGQDGKDTSTIFNSGFYHKDDFKSVIKSFAGDGDAELSNAEIQQMKTKVKQLEAERDDQLKLNEFYKNSTPAKEYLSRIQDKAAFEERVREMENTTDRISDVRVKRNRYANKRTLWNGTLKELKSLNRNIEVGELRCMDCDSDHIAYKGKGKITYSFDVSTPEMRKQIISSIEDRISAYTEEIEKCDYEISTLQNQIEDVMRDEDITIENILAYKNGFTNSSEIESKVFLIDSQIKEIKVKVKTGIKQSDDTKKAQDLFYEAIIEKMNKIKHQIDSESDQDYDDVFTKRGSVVSGSEETVYYISRLLSVLELTQHKCPIIMDSFRAEDLSTDKEERVLKIMTGLKCQSILTTTLKAEEKDKYIGMPDVNAIDYTNHQSNKVLNEKDHPAFEQLLNAIGIKIEGWK